VSVFGKWKRFGSFDSRTARVIGLQPAPVRYDQ
jgi:hypothetical protein